MGRYQRIAPEPRSRVQDFISTHRPKNKHFFIIAIALGVFYSTVAVTFRLPLDDIEFHLD